MNISEDWINKLYQNKLVNDLIVYIVGGFIVIYIGVIVTNYFKKKRLIKSLLSEIEVNQNRLYPFLECVDVVLDGDGMFSDDMFSDNTELPNDLIFEERIYSALADKLGNLDDEIRNKIVEYYSENKYIEEKYNILSTIHGISYIDLNNLMLNFEFNEKLGKLNINDNSPGWYEIEYSLRHAKQVYNLGAELIKSMKDK